MAALLKKNSGKRGWRTVNSLIAAAALWFVQIACMATGNLIPARVITATLPAVTAQPTPTATVQPETAKTEPAKTEPVIVESNATETLSPPATETTIAATDTPEPSATIAPSATVSMPDVSFQGITFNYDNSLFSSARGTVVQAVNQQDSAPWDQSPQHIEFSFDQYILQGTFHTPQIFVFPVNDFIQIQPASADVINLLKSLNQDHPNPPPDHLPFLPFWNAGPMIHTNIEYIQFQNGSGVRYLTQYGQDVSPISNQRFFYTFQGMTSDGSRYISAIFPVNNPVLPPTSDLPSDSYNQFTENYLTYIQDLKNQLDAQPPESFTPSLTLLDDLVKSIQVTP